MVLCIPDDNLTEYKGCSHEGFKGCAHDRCALPFIAVLTSLPSFQDKVSGMWPYFRHLELHSAVGLTKIVISSFRIGVEMQKLL